MIFYSQNAIKLYFLDKLSVGNHSKRFESEEDCSGKRKRGLDTEFADRFVFYAFISDRKNSKNVDF